MCYIATELKSVRFVLLAIYMHADVTMCNVDTPSYQDVDLEACVLC